MLPTYRLNIVNYYAHAGPGTAQQESEAAQDARTSGCKVKPARFVTHCDVWALRSVMQGQTSACFTTVLFVLRISVSLSDRKSGRLAVKQQANERLALRRESSSCQLKVWVIS